MSTLTKTPSKEESSSEDSYYENSEISISSFSTTPDTILKLVSYIFIASSIFMALVLSILSNIQRTELCSATECRSNFDFNNNSFQNEKKYLVLFTKLLFFVFILMFGVFMILFKILINGSSDKSIILKNDKKIRLQLAISIVLFWFGTILIVIAYFFKFMSFGIDHRFAWTFLGIAILPILYFSSELVYQFIKQVICCK